MNFYLSLAYRSDCSRFLQTVADSIHIAGREFRRVGVVGVNCAQEKKRRSEFLFCILQDAARRPAACWLMYYKPSDIDGSIFLV